MKIICILGPTGIGKTEIGVHLAQVFNGEIINADSRQVYQDLTIGTAKPKEEVFNKVPHYLFNVCNPDQQWDAAQFQQQADQVIKMIGSHQKLPVVVGGTGLYIKALLFGFFEGPPADSRVRKEFEDLIQQHGVESLYCELKKVDPESASRVHPHDSVRIIRALEVYRLTGLSISRHQENHQFKEKRYPYLKIGIQMDRAELYRRINQRVDQMIQKGLEEETKSLFEKWGPTPVLTRAIGYQEWADYFQGQGKLDDVIEKIKQNTRQFAKRQLTWFRKEKDIHWMKGSDLKGMEERIQEFIS